MSCEIRRDFKRFPANVALERFGGLVRSHVAHHARPPCEALVAHLAFEGPLAGVRSHVDLEGAGVRVAFVTDATEDVFADHVAF